MEPTSTNGSNGDTNAAATAITSASVSMKIGFQLKGATRSAAVAAKKPAPAVASLLASGHEDQGLDEDEVRKEVIVGLEGNMIQGIAPEKKVLVIPLPERDRLQREAALAEAVGAPAALSTAAHTSTALASEDSKPLSLDELAARAIVADASGQVNLDDSGPKLVIAVADAEASTNLATLKRKPLLLANVAPELLEIDNDLDRYKRDIELRPDDIDFKSDAYKAVPIEEFGAALLRGMGWEGPTKEDLEREKKGFDPVRRDERLGLGATAKPPDLDKKGGDRAKKEKAAEEWKRKAEQALAKQKLDVGDEVWLRDPLYANRHARVEAVRGVPGLDRIRVTLLDVLGPDGRPKIVEVKRTDAVLVSDADQTPEDAASLSVPRDEGSVRPPIGDGRGRSEDQMRRKDERRYGRSRSRSRDRGSRRDHTHKNEEGRGGARSRSPARNDMRRGRSRSRSVQRHNKDKEERKRDGRKRDKERSDRHEDAEGSSAKRIRDEEGPRPVDKKDEGTHSYATTWMRRGIVVRVISDRVQDLTKSKKEVYLKKFDLIDVERSGLATIRERSEQGGNVSDLLTIFAVKEKYLENVLPAVQSVGIILTGTHAGADARLLEKDKKTEEALVQLLSNSVQIRLPFAHIAAKV